jgi:two-component system response regulator AtoC
VRAARILIVDDEAQMRWALRERLTAAGYDTFEAGLASEALERILAADIDVVLLDLQLPDSDAEPVLGRIHAISPEIQIILMTSPMKSDRAIAAMKTGAYDYVNKPFNLDEVATRVERALELIQLRRDVQTLRKSQQTTVRRRSVRGTAGG